MSTSPEQEILPTLLEIAEAGNWEDVRLITQGEILTFSNFAKPGVRSDGKSDWTILHYACNQEKESDALSAVTLIFALMELFQYTSEQFDNFVNGMNSDSQTALHIAIDKGHESVVETLIHNSADVNLSDSKSNKKALEWILNRFHRIIPRLYEKGIRVHKKDFDPENERLWEIECDFTKITGIPTPRDKPLDKYRETQNLAKLLALPRIKRSDILVHPLVSIFLHIKQEKYSYFIGNSIALHIIFSVGFALHFLGCLNLHQNPIYTNCSSHFSATVNCFMITHGWKLVHYITGFLALLAVVMELVEIVICPNRKYYWKQWENKGQLWVLIVALISFTCLIFDASPSVWTQTLYTSGFVASLLLLQGQVAKVKTIGVYVHMMARSFKLLTFFLAAFSPLILALAISFALLLPKNAEFTIDWDLCIGKTLTMLTGELNYNDIFHPQDNLLRPSHPFLTKVLYIFFVIVVVILLQNLLVGLTVNDIEKLRIECKQSQLAAQLELLYIIETFVTYVCDKLGKPEWLEKYLIVPLDSLETQTKPEEEETQRLTGAAETNSTDVYRNTKRMPLEIFPEDIQELIKSKYKSIHVNT